MLILLSILACNGDKGSGQDSAERGVKNHAPPIEEVTASVPNDRVNAFDGFQVR